MLGRLNAEIGILQKVPCSENREVVSLINNPKQVEDCECMNNLSKQQAINHIN